jgi:hypothetical protein
VSRLFRKRLAAVLFPGQIAWALRERGLRARVSAHGVELTGSEGPTAWAPAISALGALLQERARPGVELAVVLSGRFAQCLVVPWPREVDDEEGNTYAAHHFRRVFGEAAAGWDVYTDCEATGGHRLACAVERELVAAIRMAAEDAKVRLISIEPLLARAFNQCRNRLGRGATLFLLAEPGRYYGAALDGGGWHGLRQGRLADASPSALGEALAREAGLCESDQMPIVVCAPAHGEPAGSAELAGRVRRVTFATPGAHAFAFMALA